MRAARAAQALLPLGALLAAACARNLPPPKASSQELAGGPVVWRDWSAQGRGAICEAEPQFLLDELTLVNSALQRFLARSEPGAPEDWPESRIGSVEAEARAVASVAEPHARNLGLLGGCAFARTGGFPWVTDRGKELLAAVEARPKELAGVFQKARAARAMAAWQRSTQELKEAARSTCPERSRGPRLYFAWRDEKGVTHWRFCDGTEVTQGAGQPLTVETSLRALGKRERRPAEKDYLAAVKAWPAAEVHTPPERPSGAAPD